MKKFRLIPAFLLSAALFSGLTGCKKETEYYNPSTQTSQSVTETQTLESTEGSTEASTEESTEEPTEASTEESTEGYRRVHSCTSCFEGTCRWRYLVCQY